MEKGAWDRKEVGEWPSDEEPKRSEKGASWKGTRWWPGCYKSDSKLHSLELGVISDVKAFKTHGSKLKGILEQAIHETSFVYENQMHVRLVFGKLAIYKNARTAPVYAKDCKMEDKGKDEYPGWYPFTYKLKAIRNDHKLPTMPA
mmetsp:Transcript_52980/g.119330  ORF Transcript_52980/g.119330 Transcript_52980/m.119330 type:complete len:145 (+) Transcript_52980:698-1132(+)